MTYIYAGFLSYAHADEAVAARLHQALETYKIPKGHERTLSPIFRDTAELTAHHSLSEKIRDAVTGSRVLIVLCSPAAKTSHWVNEEIRLFRDLHGEGAILCVLAEGTPDTAFPPALLEGGREPLAANLGASRESFKLGVTQLAAAMLGVGLDVLIQREARRKRSRWQVATAAALVFSTVMGATTLSAVTARKAAEANRMQAEGLVEYMITDLKEKLEPVGRLDILDGIGQRAVEYYDAQDIAKLPDDSLARQARSRHILGQVALDAGEFDKARTEIETAARLTKEVYDRNPDDPDAIFAHAQSEYWVGAVYYYEKNYEQVLPYWETYARYAKLLLVADPNELDWVMEGAWSENNLGLIQTRLTNFDLAKEHFLTAAEYFEAASKISPNNMVVTREWANIWAGLSRIEYRNQNLDLALKYRFKQVEIYKSQIRINPQDKNLRYLYAQSLSRVVFFDAPNQNIEVRQKLLNECITEYDKLIEYEPDNKSWRQDYLAFLQEMTKISKDDEAFLPSLDRIESRLKELQSL